MCCCSSPTRIWLFLILLLWLLLSIARQVFDLIGKLWIPVIFNLLQILSCINGLFAASQQRLSLLLTLTFSSIISILYNAILILWYAGVLGDRTKPVLSAGLPLSHSFFLRYTPSCQSHYNLTTNQWVQHTNCLIPYYNIEGFQALIHIIIAILTMLFSLLLFCQRRTYVQEKKIKGIYASSNSSASSSNENRQMPNLHNAIYGEAESSKANTRELPPPPDSINDVSSGYMNSSYEAIAVENFKGKNNNPQPKARKAKNSQPSSRASQRPKSQAQESQSDYSSVTTKSLGTNTSNESAPSRLRPPLNTTYKKKILVNRSVSPIRRISDEGFSEEDEVARQYSKMRTKSHEPQKTPQSLAEQRLSQAAMEQLKKEAAAAAAGKINKQEDNGEYLEYIKAERKPSIKNKTSLISFDPKSSSNTLLRVHEHIDEDGGEEEEVEEEWASTRSADNGYKEVMDCGIKMRAKRTTSQDSVPSIQAPTLSMMHASNNLDSGHPSSNSAEQSISPDWSHAGIYHVTQRPTMSPPLPPVSKVEDKIHNIIGYEPAIHDPKPPMPSYHLQRSHHVSTLPGYNPPSTSTSSHGTSFGSYRPEPHQPQESHFQHERETHGISLSAAIPLLNSLPTQQTSSSSTRFLAQPPPIPDYAIPSDSSHYFSPDDYGLKLRSPTSPIIGYERDPQRESTQFDSKPPPTAPIILSNQGLLV